MLFYIIAVNSVIDPLIPSTQIFTLYQKIIWRRGAYMTFSLYLCTSQCESRGLPSSHGQIQGVLTFCRFSCDRLSNFSCAPLCQNSILYYWDGDLFILNVRTASGFEHHCHNSLGGTSESCQNPLGCPWGIHTGVLELYNV